MLVQALMKAGPDEPRCYSGSFSPYPISTPIRRIRSPCCARAASGHAAAAAPSSVMNSILAYSYSTASPW